MSQTALFVFAVLPTVAVVAAMIYVMWSARTSARTAQVAIVASVVLVAWGVVTTVLTLRGVYLPPQDLDRPPTVGIELAISLAALAFFLVASPSLRSLLSNQRHLLRLNVWRLVGAVFLALMFAGQAPALWALPAGVGDLIVGSTAFWVASRFDQPGGKGLAVAFNIFGLCDLVVAIGLGVTTSPGPAQLFHTTPTAEIMTRFPMALVPTYLVPLAFVLHIVSLWQILGRSWRRPALEAPVPERAATGSWRG